MKEANVHFRYLMDSGPDFTMALRQSSPTTPLLILFTQERNTAEIMFSEFANRKEAKTLVVPLSGTGIVEERKAIVCLQKAMNEVSQNRKVNLSV